MRSLAIAVAVFVVVAGAQAQQPGFSRTVIQRGDLSTPGREVVSAIAEFLLAHGHRLIDSVGPHLAAVLVARGVT